MSLFDRFKGSSGAGAEAKPEQQRAHQRVDGAGLELRIVDGPGGQQDFPVVDVSLGGFCIGDYHGKLKANQYFEFRLTGERDGQSVDANGFANVVRVFNDRLAAKFPPQPRLKKLLRDTLGL